MDMIASELTEMERVLRNHQEWILDDYEKARDNHSSAYLKLAGYLRILLVDGDLPVLLRRAKEKGKVLYAYVEDSDLRTLEGKATWVWSGFVISSTPEQGSKRITIEEFLDRAIGLYSDEQGLARSYTPRQLIKYAANKEGVAHLDLKKPRALEQMKLMTISDGRRTSDSQEIRHAVRAIAGWTYNAISYVLDDALGAQPGVPTKPFEFG
jgi:hypothetical protein